MNVSAACLPNNLRMENTDSLKSVAPVESLPLKGIIFDYGGTIDSRGVHWSEVIWDGYRDSGVDVTKEDFREAYVHAERELARTRHILPHHNFYDLLLIKMRVHYAFRFQQFLRFP